MQVSSNTLRVTLDTWDDPGDYPSGAGQGPLPSYQYIAGLEGEIVFNLTQQDMIEIHEDIDEFLKQALNQILPKNVSVINVDVYELNHTNNQLTINGENIQVETNRVDEDYQ